MEKPFASKRWGELVTIRKAYTQLAAFLVQEEKPPHVVLKVRFKPASKGNIGTPSCAVATVLAPLPL